MNPSLLLTLILVSSPFLIPVILICVWKGQQDQAGFYHPATTWRTTVVTLIVAAASALGIAATICIIIIKSMS